VKRNCIAVILYSLFSVENILVCNICFCLFYLGCLPSKPLHSQSTAEKNTCIYSIPSISVDCDVCVWLCSIGVSQDDFPIHHTIPITSKVRNDNGILSYSSLVQNDLNSMKYSVIFWLH
jgi:hypothetical protein